MYKKSQKCFYYDIMAINVLLKILKIRMHHDYKVFNDEIYYIRCA